MAALGGLWSRNLFFGHESWCFLIDVSVAPSALKGLGESWIEAKNGKKNPKSLITVLLAQFQSCLNAHPHGKEYQQICLHLRMFVPTRAGTKQQKPQVRCRIWSYAAPASCTSSCCRVGPARAWHFPCLQPCCLRGGGFYSSQAALCTWFKFKAHLHMMSHFYCQPREGQDSSFWEGLHCWAFTDLPLMPSPSDFSSLAWCNEGTRYIGWTGVVGTVAEQPGLQNYLPGDQGWKLLLCAPSRIVCTQSRIWPEED